MTRTAVYMFMAAFLLLAGCRKEETEEPYAFSYPAGFPEMPIPSGNELTKERIDLGKMLFFDKRLSRDSSISCASCHLPENAFSDVLSFSKGVANRDGFRNSPSLANVGYHPYFFKDGGVTTLEMQVLAPLSDHLEMDIGITAVVERLKNDPVYKFQAQQNYGREFDAFVLTRAVSCFERSLVSGNSPYDKYTFQNQPSALDASEKRGMELFNSTRANCSTCHSGFNFTDYSFRNNGLYTTYADTGRMRITLLEQDRAMFKVASLRNVALTAPYMHDGSFNTLEQVVEHYNSGGEAHVNKDPRIKPSGLTAQEKQDLVNFLRSLTDEEFVTDQRLRP